MFSDHFDNHVSSLLSGVFHVADIIYEISSYGSFIRKLVNILNFHSLLRIYY